MVKRYLIPLMVGLFGVLIGLGVWHVYEDHHNFHALLNWANAVAANAAKAQAPQK